jgi:hypothetical protein
VAVIPVGNATQSCYYDAHSGTQVGLKICSDLVCNCTSSGVTPTCDVTVLKPTCLPGTGGSNDTGTGGSSNAGTGGSDDAGALTCGDKTCGPDMLCIEIRSGLDGGRSNFSCDPIPTACASTLTCACLQTQAASDPSDFVLQSCLSTIGLTCEKRGELSFACGE